MTDNSQPTEKLRAVFLAALMVMSVFAMSMAFAGGATALTGTNAGNTVATDVTTAGVQANHTANVTVESGDAIEGDDLTEIEVDYSAFGTTNADTLSDVISNDDATVLVNGNTVSGVSVSQGSTTDDDSAVIDIADTAVSADDTVEVQLTGVNNPESVESNDVDIDLTAANGDTVGTALTLETTEPNIDVQPEQTVNEIGTASDFEVTVTDSNGDPIDGVTVQADSDGGTTLVEGDDTGTTTNSTVDGVATFTVTNQTDQNAAFTDSIDFTEQLSTAGNSTTGTYITTDQNRGVLTGDIKDLDGNIPDNVGDTEITIVGTDANDNEIYNETFSADSSGAADEYTRSVPTQGDGTQYEVSASLAGFDDFSGTPTVTPGETTTQSIRVERIITPDEINIVDVSSSDEVDVDESIDVTVNVTTDDFANTNEQEPLEDTPVEAGVVSETLPDGAADIFIGADGTNETVNTDANGEATFTVSVDPATDYDSIEEVAETTIGFTATENNSVTTSQDLTFVGEPESGNGFIDGDVDQISDDIQVGALSQNSNSADDVNVHAVQFDRVGPNTLVGGDEAAPAWAPTGSTTNTSLSVNDDTEHVRVAALDSDGNIVEYLDVQTDYLFKSETASVSQNLTIEGTGFTVEDTTADASDYSVHALETGDYEVQISSDGSFDAPTRVEFTAENNLTYAGIEDRYSDVQASPTDVTGEDGAFSLQSLYTNDESGLQYLVIAGDGDGALGFANGQGYDAVSVQQAADPTTEQQNVGLNVQQVDVQADSVDITNNGTHPPLSETGGAPDVDEITTFDDQSDDFRQEVPRDGQTIDVIDLRTFLDEGDRSLGGNVTLSLSGDASFDGQFVNAAVNGTVLDHTGDTITIDTEDGEASAFLETDDASLGDDIDVTIDATMPDAPGSDSTDKRFVGVLDQEYQSGSITGVVSDDADNPVDARIYVSELSDDDADISLTFEPDSDSLEDFTVTVYDDPTPANGNVVETVNVTANQMRNFEFEGFDSQLELADGQDEFELLADRIADRTTLSPVPAVANDPGVSLALTGVSQTGATGTSVSTAIEVNRTSTGSIVIDEALNADFQLSNLSPEEYTAGSDETFNVSATVENVGDITGEQDIELRLEPDGDAVATRSLELDAGASDSVEFEVDASNIDAGEYNHTIASENDEISGNLTVESSGNGANWYDSYVNSNNVVEDGGLNTAVQDYLDNDLSDERLNAVVSSYIGGEPIETLE